MRSHKLSPLSEKDSQYVFSTKIKKKQKNQIKKIKITKIGKKYHEHHTFFMIQNLFALLAFQDEDYMHLHPKHHGKVI